MADSHVPGDRARLLVACSFGTGAILGDSVAESDMIDGWQINRETLNNQKIVRSSANARLEGVKMGILGEKKVLVSLRGGP